MLDECCTRDVCLVGVAAISRVVNSSKNLDAGTAQTKTHTSGTAEKIHGLQVGEAFAKHLLFLQCGRQFYQSVSR